VGRIVIALAACSACLPQATLKENAIALPPPPADPAQIPAYVGAQGKFGTPSGPGPFPSVVIMHGCSGPPEHYEWVKRLNDWGYAAYYIDSFTPRNLTHVCAEHQITGYDRVDDAYT